MVLNIGKFKILTYIQSETPSVWQYEAKAMDESRPDTLS